LYVGLPSAWGCADGDCFFPFLWEGSLDGDYVRNERDR